MSSNNAYVFDEDTRLRWQSTVLDPLTERFLSRAGLSPGMRVLDRSVSSRVP